MIRARNTVGGIALLAFWFGLTATLHAQTFERASGEEYQVYSAVLNHKFEGELASKDRYKELVIRGETIAEPSYARSDDNWKFVKDSFAEITDGTLLAFAQAKRTQAKLARSVAVKLPYTLLASGEVATIHKNGRWDLFEKNHPHSDGFFAFSRVGFDSSRQQAFLYLEHVCPGLCSSGHYIFLKKEGQAWKVVGSWMPWIS